MVVFQALVWLSILTPIVAFLILVVTLPLQIVNIINGGKPIEYKPTPQREEVVMLYPMEKGD